MENEKVFYTHCPSFFLEYTEKRVPLKGLINKTVVLYRSPSRLIVNEDAPGC